MDAKIAEIAKSYPLSIAAHYHAIPSVCAAKPFRPHLYMALQRYAASRRAISDKDLDDISTDHVMVLHVVHRTPHTENSTSLSQVFLNQAGTRAKSFRSIIILPFADQGASHESVQKDLDLLRNALGKAPSFISVRSSQGADEDTYLMHVAKHLMVHRGSMSALGALVCRGTVYYTPEISDYMKQNAFRWLVSDARTAVEEKIALPRKLLYSMGPVLPSCCRLTPFGTGDGEKIICANAKRFSRVQDEPCWILSVGCGSRWHFEEGVVARTKCHVHTFDCTNDFTVPQNLRDRVTVHKLCLGKENDERDMFVGWSHILDIGEKNSGGKVARLPVMAKIDIEGYEFPVLQELVANVDASQLPEQLAIEIHSFAPVRVGPPYVKDRRFGLPIANERVMSGLFRNLSSVGYSLVHRADNPFCGKCSEVTLVQRAGLPDVS